MNDKQGQPWWKFGHVWMVVSGPAIVIVASFFTLYLAITIPDPVSYEPGHRQADRIDAPKMDDAPNLAPAMQARNHAATGVPASKP